MNRNKPLKTPPDFRPLPRAVIYCRVSDPEQVLNLSLTTQERACRAYCEREGLTVARIFVEEGETAKTTTNRTKLLELLDYCREQKGTIKHVVVFKIDRFSRNQYDHIIPDAQLKKFD